jgi:septal ring factor EnvC (AmiA/AmiB activator)
MTLLILAAFLPPPSASASSKEDETRQSLREAERQNAEQQAVSKEAAERVRHTTAQAARLAQERVAAAAKLLQADAETQDVTARIDALATQRRDAERRMHVHAAAMQPLLPLIERLSLYRAETLLAMPGDPRSTLRGVFILKGLSRKIEQEAEQLREDQSDRDAAIAKLQAEATKLAEAEAAQKQQADALDRAIELAHAQQAKADAEASLAASRAARAAARAESLRAAVAVLDAPQGADALAGTDRMQRQKGSDTEEAERKRRAMQTGPTLGAGGAAALNGQLQPPVIGVVVKNWGAETDSGPATGVSYHAPPGARVIAPCGGRIVFADTFRSYGLLLIIDCGSGYHVVLAGFDRLDVKLGQRIVAGEPVGVMPSWDPGLTTKRPALYVELRHDGQPINPAPWLKSSS